MSLEKDKSVEKRVVVHIVTGRRTGMRRIIGHLVYNVGDELPQCFDKVHICDGEPPVDVHFAGEFQRYILYKELPPEIPVPRAKVLVRDGVHTTIPEAP